MFGDADADLDHRELTGAEQVDDANPYGEGWDDGRSGGGGGSRWRRGEGEGRGRKTPPPTPGGFGPDHDANYDQHYDDAHGYVFQGAPWPHNCDLPGCLNPPPSPLTLHPP